MKETLENIYKNFSKIKHEDISSIYRAGYKNGFNDAIKEREILVKIGIALIESDERGQGLPWQEAMKELHTALGYNAELTGRGLDE